jgi:hypothetical protein
MTEPSEPEHWLRGPVAGVPPLLQPAAHALLQVGDEAERAAAALTVDELWLRPAGLAPAGFHLRHIAGVLDRLLSYARGERLTPGQLEALAREGEPGDPPETAAALISTLRTAIDRAMDELRSTPESSLLQERRVGRQGLPSTALGLIFHAAEHSSRHVGQLLVTARVVAGMSSPGME